MALFKILRGDKDQFIDEVVTLDTVDTVQPKFVDGYCYFVQGTNMFYVDYATYNADNTYKTVNRVPLNAQNANTLTALEPYYGEDGTLLHREIPAYVTQEVVFNGPGDNGFNRIPTLSALRGYVTGGFLPKKNSVGTGYLHYNYGTEEGKEPGVNSFSVGTSNHATGVNAFAAGKLNEASGADSFALGVSNISSGRNSYALGSNLLSKGNEQFVVGRWNVEDTESNYAVIVGGGVESDGTPIRKNICTLDWSGNLIVPGNITSAYPQADNHLTTRASVVELVEPMISTAVNQTVQLIRVEKGSVVE